MGCWRSALAFVRNCGVGPPPGFAFPVALHPHIRPVCAYQFLYAASGIMVSSFKWFGLLPRLCYYRVAIRHQCLVVSLIIEVLPTISSCVAHSCGLLYYAFFFLRVELQWWCHLQAMELPELYLVCIGNLQAYSSSVCLCPLWLPPTGFRNPAVGTH
jgi:hypothetical protein